MEINELQKSAVDLAGIDAQQFIERAKIDEAGKHQYCRNYKQHNRKGIMLNHSGIIQDDDEGCTQQADGFVGITHILCHGCGFRNIKQ